MKIIKYLVIALVILIGLFVAGAAILVATVDPNDHKESIVSAVKDATGRDLKLEGDIGFSFFPKLGVKLGQAEFSNAKGFGDEPFARVDKVGVSVDLLSLLKMKVQADTIELKGLRVNLQKNKNGKTNWDDLSANSTASTGSDTAASKEGSSIGLEVAGIHITDSQVIYDDRQAGNKLTLNPIELTTGSIGSGKASKITAQLGLSQTNPAITADVDLNTNARLNIGTAVYQLTDLVLAINAKGETLPNGKLNLKVNSDVEANLKSESLKLDPIDIRVADVELDGSVSVKSFSNPSIKFALHSKEIDLAKLIPASDSSASSASAGVSSTASESSDAKIELPIDMLRSLKIDGSLNVGKLLASGLTMTDINAKINGKGGVINLNPLTMNLYQGAYTGSAGLNVSGKTPKYSASSDLKNLAVAGLMEDLSDDGKSIIRGKTQLAFNVTTSGDRPSTLTKRLNGNASFKAAEGALQSKKLAQNVEKVIAFLKGREPKPAGEELVFDSLAGTFNIQNGVAKNNDLKLITPLIYANGKGDINIGESDLDYVMAIGLSEEPGKAAIPITIKGPFEKPKYGVDFKAALNEKQKQVVEEKKEEVKEKINEKIKDKLGDKLKGIKLF